MQRGAPKRGTYRTDVHSSGGKVRDKAQRAELKERATFLGQAKPRARPQGRRLHPSEHADPRAHRWGTGREVGSPSTATHTPGHSGWGHSREAAAPSTAPTPRDAPACACEEGDVSPPPLSTAPRDARAGLRDAARQGGAGRAPPPQRPARARRAAHTRPVAPAPAARRLLLRGRCRQRRGGASSVRSAAPPSGWATGPPGCR